MNDERTEAERELARRIALRLLADPASLDELLRRLESDDLVDEEGRRVPPGEVLP